MQNDIGVTFACVNVAAPAESNDGQKGGDTASGASDAAAHKPGIAPTTWALRVKPRDRVEKLIAALEKAKTEYCQGHAAAASAAAEPAAATGDAAV